MGGGDDGAAQRHEGAARLLSRRLAQLRGDRSPLDRNGRQGQSDRRARGGRFLPRRPTRRLHQGSRRRTSEPTRAKAIRRTSGAAGDFFAYKPAHSFRAPDTRFARPCNGSSAGDLRQRTLCRRVVWTEEVSPNVEETLYWISTPQSPPPCRSAATQHSGCTA